MPSITQKSFQQDTGRAIALHGGAGALNILIVEDDDSVRAVCAEIAISHGCQVRTAEDVDAARMLLNQGRLDVVFLDLRLPGGSGTSLLDEIHVRHPSAFIVVMTAYATVTAAVDLMRKGAGDFIAKPFALDRITAVLERATEYRHSSEPSRIVQDQLEAGIAPGRLTGHSPAMQRLFRILSKVAFTRHPVLILGEHGSGKEVTARAIHAIGPHASHPFLPVDCDSLDPSRLETELFGISEGDRQRDGLLAAAGEGTVYLAEIDFLSQTLQARLLRVLQEKKVAAYPTAPLRPMVARVLASSSRNLEAMVADGRFRKDLFYRLNVVNLRVPALRDRSEDIPDLAAHFLDEQRRERGVQYTLSDETLQRMLSYDWPGNVQELESVIEHACAFSSGPVILMDDMTTQVRSYALATTDPLQDQAAGEARPALFKTLEEIEKDAIRATLHSFRGDKVQTAKHLGIGKTTLYRKLKEYGLGGDTL